MKHKKIFADYVFKHYMDYTFSEFGLCSLCGNTGKIVTTPLTPRGQAMGRFENFCICLNGRAMRGE
jgi:hypothetical protein